MSTKRNTLQRQIILDTIRSHDAHLSAEELYLEIQKEHPIVGKSTVYRNLRQLVEDGVVMQKVMKGVVRYDKETGVHHHFLCDVCGKIIDVALDCEEDLCNMIKSKYGFEVKRHETEFFGTCSDCATAHKNKKN